MANSAADRNLLFGILSLQMDFISRDSLINAMHAWILDKSKPLGHILVEQKALSSERQLLLEALVQEHLKQHDNDLEWSLAAVRSIQPVRQELEQIADPDLQASLAHLAATCLEGEDPNATRPLAVGTPTSSGLRFRILRPHAEGGLGRVMVAHDEELNREVALKEIKDWHADNPESRSRFLLEAEITGGLEHPSIVPVYGLGTYADGRPFYAMRFIKGDSLKDAIAAFHQAESSDRDSGERTLELRKLLGRFLDVCNAIAYAHSRGVLHRDLKPGNIMLGKYGETLVVDWGLAKPVGRRDVTTTWEEQTLRPASARGAAETTPGVAIGTPAYMSPEQAMGRLDLLGPSSDVYSLGATLYTLLTGQASCTGSDRAAVLQQVQRGDFLRPRQVKREVSPALEAVCLKAMALKPEDRYASPRELGDDLEHWFADEPVAAYPEPPAVRLRRWGRRHRVFVSSGAVAALVAFIGLTVGLIVVTGLNQQLDAANAGLVQTNAQLDTAQKDAEARRVDAEQSRILAEKQTGLAEDRLENARHSLYDSQLALIASRWSEDPGLSLQLLDDPSRCPEGLRDYTWRFFHRLCRRDHVRWAAHDTRVSFVGFIPDGKTLVTAGHDGAVKLWDPTTGVLRQTLNGQGGPVTAAALAPDGKLLVTGDRSGQVKLWDLSSAQQRRGFSGHAGQVQSVALSPDGRQIAASSTGTLLLWDTADGVVRSRQKGPPGAFWALAFRPDGKMLVAGGAGAGDKPLSGSLRLYSGADYSELVQSPDFEFGSFTALAFGADGMALLALTNTGGLIRLDLGTFHFLPYRPVVAETGVALALAPDGRTLATATLFGLHMTPGHSPREAAEEAPPAGGNGPQSIKFQEIAATAHYRPVRLWEPGSLQPRSYVHGVDADVYSLAFSPDAKLLATGDEKGQVTLWDLNPRLERATLGAEGQEVYRLRFAADGRSLLGGSKHLLLWDTVTGKSRLPAGLKLDAKTVASPDGRRLLVPVEGPNPAPALEVWDLCEGQPLRRLDKSAEAADPVFGPDGRTVAAVWKDGGRAAGIRLWDSETGNFLRNLDRSADVYTVVFAADGRTLVGAVKKDKETEAIRVWETASGQCLLTLENSAGTFDPQFSPDGRLLAARQSEKDEHQVKIWDAGTGKLRAVWNGLRFFPRQVVFSPNGTTLAAVGHEHAKGIMLRQWDIDSGREVAALDDPMPSLQAVTVSPDGRVLALGGGSRDFDKSEGEVILWDLAVRRERTRLKGHRSTVWSLAFSPDSKTVASGGFDYLAKLWDAATGLELATLEGHQSTVLTVVFSPDGQVLATGSYDQTVKLWVAPTPTTVLAPWSLRGLDAHAFGQQGPKQDDSVWVGAIARQVRLQERLDKQRQSALENPTNLGYPRELAEGYSALAVLQMSLGQREAAVGALQLALPYRRRLAEAGPTNEDQNIKLADCLNNLGDLQRAIGDIPGALANGSEALAIRKKLAEASPADLGRQSQLGGSYNNVGMALQAQGKLPEALTHYEKAIEYQRRAFDASPQVAQYRLYLRNHFANLAHVRRALNQPADAAEAARAFKELFPKDPINLYTAAQELAQCVPLVAAGKPSVSPEEQAERKKYMNLAVESLREAIQAGFRPLDSLNRDGAFQSIRDEPAFKALLPRPPGTGGHD
jgi:WD40 repeat protein/tetratricopeptide (TPR) repeat protein/tRNA A-37 threonylcarbamoyl transferase component Bud32